MRVHALVLLLLAVAFACSIGSPSDESKIEKVVTRLLSAYAENDIMSFSDLVHPEFAWSGHFKDWLVDLAQNTRSAREHMEVDSLRIEIRDVGFGVWRVAGVVVFSATYLHWPVPQKETRTFMWLLRRSGGRFALWGLEQEWLL